MIIAQCLFWFSLFWFLLIVFIVVVYLLTNLLDHKKTAVTSLLGTPLFFWGFIAMCSGQYIWE